MSGHLYKTRGSLRQYILSWERDCFREDTDEIIISGYIYVGYILKFGAFYSICKQGKPAFERYFSQLNTYYKFYTDVFQSVTDLSFEVSNSETWFWSIHNGLIYPFLMQISNSIRKLISSHWTWLTLITLSKQDFSVSYRLGRSSQRDRSEKYRHPQAHLHWFALCFRVHHGLECFNDTFEKQKLTQTNTSNILLILSDG